MKCHYVTDKDGKRYLIPGCMPGWYSDSACICRMGNSSRLDDPRDKLIGELERENARLNRLLNKLLTKRAQRANK